MSEVALYREFRVNKWNISTVINALRALWRNAVAPLVEQDKRVLVIFTTDEPKRNVEQNKRYWGFILKTIAEQAFVNGRKFDKDVWHEHFARKFLAQTEMVLPDGEIILRRKSTTELSVSEFTEYMNDVEAEAAMELGVTFDGA